MSASCGVLLPVISAQFRNVQSVGPTLQTQVYWCFWVLLWCDPTMQQWQGLPFPHLHRACLLLLISASVRSRACCYYVLNWSCLIEVWAAPHMFASVCAVSAASGLSTVFAIPSAISHGSSWGQPMMPVTVLRIKQDRRARHLQLECPWASECSPGGWGHGQRCVWSVESQPGVKQSTC